VSADVVELTRELVATRTINPPGDEAKAASLVGARLEAAGFTVEPHEFDDGRTSLVARWGVTAAPSLCLTGHLDTVPLGKADWSVDPFSGETDGDRLFGRGTSDMKGGTAAIVVAAERVAALGEGAAGLELVLCAGEETGCEGALALADAGVLGRCGAVLVAEPTTNYPCVAHKGVVWADAVARGKTAHGSMPELGENAIYALARAVGRLEDFSFEAEEHELLGRPTVNLGTFSGGININSVPDYATAGIDVRTVPGLDGDAVLAALRDRLGGEVELEPRVMLDPIDTDPSGDWVQEVFSVMSGLIDDAPAARGLAYFTDAAALSPAYGSPPTIICGPGDAEQAHRTDESCSMDALEAAGEGFFEIARRWCGR
jgi:succinyl-diaminopimelate desuccinylase